MDIVVGDLNEGVSYRSLFYSDNWAPVYLTDRYVIAVPKYFAQKNKLMIFDAVDPYSETAAKPGQEKRAISQYKLLLSDQPDSYYFKFFLANSLAADSRLNEAKNILLKLNTDTSPESVLLDLDKNSALSKIYFSLGDCKNAKFYLDKAYGDVKNKLIFSPFRLISNYVYKDYAFYFISCEKNQDKANYFLRLYLKDKLIDPLEKIRTSNQFKQLAK
jgi:hypothetical protein